MTKFIYNSKAAKFVKIPKPPAYACKKQKFIKAILNVS